MAIQTRQVTVTINDVDGQRVPGARVVIRLRGLGNSPNGAVAPAEQEQLTDENGQCVFTLWENNQLYSDTYYEVTSFHPRGTQIHRRETFRVYDSDANLAELIAGGLVAIDPTQALADQVAADRAAAAGYASQAEGHADDAHTARLGAEAARDTTLTYRNQAEVFRNSAQDAASFASSSESVIQGHLSDAIEARNIAQSAASTSTTQAGIATTQASIATNAANAAGDSEDNAATSAGTATNQAGIATTGANTATTQAGIATNAASTATTQASTATTAANTATTQAGIATTKADEASDSADAASTSETNANQHRIDAESARDVALAAAATVNNIHNGDGAPAGSLGDEDDYYIDNTAKAIYGPKTVGGWGSPTPLIGPEGPQGPQGLPGETGLTLPGATTNGYLATWVGTGGDEFGQLDPATFVSAATGWGGYSEQYAGDDIHTIPIGNKRYAVQGSTTSNMPDSEWYYVDVHEFRDFSAGTYRKVTATGATGVNTGKTLIKFKEDGVWGSWIPQLSTNSYDELTDKPSLSAVATSGNYSDLSGTPSLAAVATSGAYSDLSGTPNLADVATSGDYGDLDNKPSLGTASGRDAVTNTGDTTGNRLIDKDWFDANLPESGGDSQVYVELGVVGASGSETVTLDLDGVDQRANTIYVMEMHNSAGTITLDYTNLPPAASVWSIHIAIRRPGRKSLSPPATWVWANGAVPNLTSNLGFYALVNIQHMPFMPQARAVLGHIVDTSWT